MENKSEISDLRENIEERDILKREHCFDNSVGIVGLFCATNQVVKSFNDGYISNDDLANRKNFLDQCTNSEPYLIASLGLLEKSNNPKDKKLMEYYKKNLAAIRICCSYIREKTPPTYVAKRRQKIQEARQEQIANGTLNSISSAANNVNNLNHDPFLLNLFGNSNDTYDMLDKMLKSGNAPFKLTNNEKLNKQNALLFAILIASLNKEASKKFLTEAERHNKDKEKLDPISSMLFDGINLMRGQGFSLNEIRELADIDLCYPSDAAKIQKLFVEKGLKDLDFNILQKGNSNHGFAQVLKESISKSNIAAENGYDYSVSNDRIKQTINKMSKDDLITHQMNLLAQKTHTADVQTATQKKKSFLDIFRKNVKDSVRE